MRAWVGTGVVVCALATTARADESVAEAAAAEIDLSAIQIHAFVSQGFLKTTDNNFLANTERGSFEFTEAGINFSKGVSDRLRVGLQLFARDLGPLGDYSPKVDWAFFDYRWRDWLGVRAGRVKIPYGLYNDVADIDAARSVVLLPQSLYSATSRDFLLAQSGFELYGYRPIKNLGALDYRAYLGTVFIDFESPPGSPFVITKLEIPYVTGGRLMWELPIDGLRLGGSFQYGRLDAAFLDQRDPMMIKSITSEVKGAGFVGSIEYINDELSIAGEYVRRYSRNESSDPMFPTTETTSQGGYAMAAYRARPWLQVGGYYSMQFPNVDRSTGRSARQLDGAATLRFDITQNWIVKLEAHHMRGTAVLQSALNDGRTQEQLANRWLLFVAKATVYF